VAELMFPELEHRWLMNPYTVTERRREMNVRQATETVRLFPKKYMDIDTGKFITDKLETLYSVSFGDLFDHELNDSFSHYAVCDHRHRIKGKENIIPWFKPKDDDFDRETERIEQEKKAAAIEKERQERQHSEERRKQELKEEIERHKRLRELEEQEYQLKVQARELELQAEMWAARERVINRRPHQVICMNKWIPK
jgi:hypothetical protein